MEERSDAAQREHNRAIFAYVEVRRGEGADDLDIVNGLMLEGLADDLREAAAAPRVFDALERVIAREARAKIRPAGQKEKKT